MVDIHKLRRYAIMAFIALSPIVYTNTRLMDLREFQERSFQLGAMALFSIFVGNFWIGAFLFWNVISLLLNDFTVGLPQVLNIFVGCILFSISRSYFKKVDSKPYLNILLWVGVLNIIWMIFQVCGIDPLYIGQSSAGVVKSHITFTDPVGLFGIKMAGGIFFAILIPILAGINLWLLPLLAIPLYLTRSSIAVVAIFVSFGFYLYHLHRKLFIYFILLGTILGGVYVYLDFKDDSQTFGSRFPIWHAALKYSLKRPIGYGPDSYRSYTKQKNFLFYGDRDYNPAILTKVSGDKAMFQYYEMNEGTDPMKGKQILPEMTINWWDNPHNEYVQQMFEYGFVGLFLLFGLFYEMYHRFRLAIKSKELVIITSCLIVYAVAGLGHFPLHLARLACLAPILLGIFMARTDEVTSA